MPQEHHPDELPASIPGPLTPGQLKALYPYQFAGPGVRWFSFAHGWMPVIETMCHEVDVLVRGRLDRYSFEWLDFKQKFGVGRFYYRLTVLSDPDRNSEDSDETKYLRARLLDIVFRAEERTASLCEFCGQPGEMVAETAWRATLCPEHAAMHRRREPLYCSLADDGSALKLP